ncbi:MAG: DUF3515 family protein [Nostocoides sp.]
MHRGARLKAYPATADRRRTHRVGGPLLVLAVAIFVGGCSGDVAVHVPARAGECGSPTWPAKVGSATRTPTDPADPAVAAWGDPPIIARCGLADQGPSTDPCVRVDGIDWVARTLTDGTALTSFGTSPAIELLVPSSYDPAPLLLPAFSAIASGLPTNGHRCS